ncbi:hypothetical protein Tco_0643914 [Tanacetum coccineum]
MKQRLNMCRLLESTCLKLETNIRLDDINDLILGSFLLHEKPIILFLPNEVARGSKDKIGNTLLTDRILGDGIRRSTIELRSE